MDDYVSTNVRISRDQIKALKMRAIEEGKSMGQVLREILAVGMNKQAPPPPSAVKAKRFDKKNPFAEIVALGSGPVKDSASDHDRYLYGKSKREWKS